MIWMTLKKCCTADECSDRVYPNGTLENSSNWIDFRILERPILHSDPNGKGR